MSGRRLISSSSPPPPKLLLPLPNAIGDHRGAAAAPARLPRFIALSLPLTISPLTPLAVLVLFIIAAYMKTID